MGDSGPRSRRSPLRDPSEYSIDTRSISFFFFLKKNKGAGRVRAKVGGDKIGKMVANSDRPY